MWIYRLPVHIGPAVCIVFTETCSESATFSGPAESSAPTLPVFDSPYFVGVDDSIHPQDVPGLQ